MLDVVTSQKIKPFSPIRLGSSSTDGEDKDYLNFDHFVEKAMHSVGSYLSFDVASHLGFITPILENETYKTKEFFTEEMIEHDIYVKMPPRKKYSIKARITRIRKAVPRIVIPEMPYTGI